MMKFVVVIFILVINSYAIGMPSGYERGNGGSFVACDAGSPLGKGVFSLDRIEGEQDFGKSVPMHLQYFYDENLIVEYILDRLVEVSPTRATLYQEWFQEMVQERRFVEEDSLSPLRDGDVTIVPQGCAIMQGAVFMTDPKQTKIQFIYDRGLWIKASPLDRASLMLHELVYREARLIENNHINSRASRYLTGWLLVHLDELTQDALLKILKGVQFRMADYNGIVISLTLYGRNGFRPAPILWHRDSGRIHKAVLYRSFNLRLSEDEVFRRHCHSEPNEKGFMEYVEFYPSGHIKDVTLSETEWRSSAECTFYKGANFLEFDESGRFYRSSLIAPKLIYDHEFEN